MGFKFNIFSGNLDLVGSGGSDPALETKVDDLIELSGVPENSTDLGSASGDIVPDNSTIKEAIDALDNEATTRGTEIDDLIVLSGVPENSTDLGTFTGDIIPDNSDNKEALQALETAIESLPDPMIYKGIWNATTNTPILTDGTGSNGDVYYVNVAGTQFTPSISFEVGDKVVYNGATAKYEKWDMTDAVASVFGRVGIVVAEADDYTADQITNVPAGSIVATDVQAAINEIQTNVESVSLQTAYDQSLVDPEIILTAELGAITLKQGSGDDTDNILEFLNGADALVALIDGEGHIETSGNIFASGDIDADGNMSAANLSGTNTGDQTITLTGDVTGSGTGSFATTLATVTSAATYGSATGVSVVTVDVKGRITSGNTTTIAIPSTQVTDFTEAAQDAVGTIVTDSNTIDFTYNDGTPSIVADVRTQMSITSDASGIKLSGDATTPGNTKYYGTDSGGTKGFFTFPTVGSAGDIQETSFSAANNQSSAADVTGFAFAAASVRSFSALVSVEIDATADLYEQFTLNGVNKAGSFNMSQESVGDSSGVVFSITSAGQVQYQSSNTSGFVTNTIRFRAITTNF